MRAPIYNKGMSLLEVVIGSAVLLSLVSLIAVYGVHLRIALSTTPKMEAVLLAEEGLEAVRFMRDSGWSTKIATLTSNTPYYLYLSGSGWVSTTTNTYIDSIFERKFILSDVYRNGTSDIVSSGTLDANTKKVSVSVSWSDHGATTTTALYTYLTNN